MGDRLPLIDAQCGFEMNSAAINVRNWGLGRDDEAGNPLGPW